jgi:hypothetical protein
MTRMPVVADRFYPAHPEGLRRIVKQMTPEVPKEAKKRALAVVMPHAGYVLFRGHRREDHQPG